MTELITGFINALAGCEDISIKQELLNDAVVHITLTKPDSSQKHLLIYPDSALRRISYPQSDEKVIHIDEHLLSNDLTKLLARIQTVLGYGKRIYARQTVAARVDKRITKFFLEEHHLQSAMTGKYRYGLFYQGELVSLAVFSGGRRMRDQPDDYRSFELIRFCHKSNLITVGGLSKLIKAFQKDFDPGDLMTYVDRDWTQDSSLQKIGFREEGILAPQIVAVPTFDYSKLDEPEERITKTNSGSTKLVLRFAKTI